MRLLAAAVLLAPAIALAAPIRVTLALRKESPAAAREAAPVERAIAEEIRQIPWLQLGSGGRTLAVDLARLGDGRVLYLQGLEAGRPLGSTTVALSTGSGGVAAADHPALRAAIVRVIAPPRYVGRLQVKVDVPGAEVEVDGKKVPADQPVEVTVGTHALRVTQAAYHDFLRFVDVGFDQTVEVPVALSAYPLTEGEMTEKLRRQKIVKKKVPWWRSWWALTLTGVVLTGVTAGIVIGTRPGIGADSTVNYRVMPSP